MVDISPSNSKTTFDSKKEIYTIESKQNKFANRSVDPVLLNSYSLLGIIWIAA